MIAISLHFLTGRFHATPWGHHVNEGVAEWPPSPWRLLRALVATFYRVSPPGVTTEHLQGLLSALAAPPSFHLPLATTAHTRHYDTANRGEKFFDTFVVLNPEDAVVCMWPETDLGEAQRACLAALLASLGTFGRAESWCEAALRPSDAVPEPNCQMLVDGQTLDGLEPVRLLLPEAQGNDLLKALLLDTSAMRRQKHLDPPGSRWVTYTRRAGFTGAYERRVRPTRRATPRPPHMTVARYALDAPVLPMMQDALPFAERMRRAFIRSRVGTTHPEVLVGKTAAGAPLEGHGHAHYLTTDEDGDGRLDHVTIYAPRGFDPDDVDALGRLRRIFQSGNRPEVWLVLIGLGPQEQFAQVPIFASSCRWHSVTPFSLPRFASRGAGKPPRPRDRPEAQLRRELRLRQLPEPVSLLPTPGYMLPGRSSVRWLEFHTRRFKGERGYGLAGFEMEFSETVTGPITLGFASHFGLGLFTPASL
ncbi:hypothetical protein NKDENANG_01440 [Candidatus Entotheonellaceae bacterium PAL068K]